jgi:PhzF family phenazine biosynthesis protein
MPVSPEILRLAAFTDDPAGGNPAGVVLDASGLEVADMQRIAAAVGYSETAFVTAAGEAPTDLAVRYFSPLAEVPFCGHATIATAVAWAQRNGAGTLRLATPAGEVVVDVTADPPRATLTSVAPRTREAAAATVAEALAALGWSPEELDPALPPRVAFAGAWHLVLAARTAARLSALDYDMDRLGALMASEGWTTLQLVHRLDAGTFSSRNPFPPGGVVEDPATGAAAAAFGGYLRATGRVREPQRLLLVQGEDLGRRSELLVDVHPDDPRVTVSGTATPIPA